VSCVLKSLVDVVSQVQSCFMVQASPCFLIELSTKELKLCTLLFSLFAGKLDLKSGLHECKVARDLEVILEGSQV
jgi:hypothetical protein